LAKKKKYSRLLKLFSKSVKWIIRKLQGPPSQYATNEEESLIELSDLTSLNKANTKFQSVEVGYK
jgi:hypothetical protein